MWFYNGVIIISGIMKFHKHTESKYLMHKIAMILATSILSVFSAMVP